jgi:hypothetical protein
VADDGVICGGDDEGGLRWCIDPERPEAIERPVENPERARRREEEVGPIARTDDRRGLGRAQGGAGPLGPWPLPALMEEDVRERTSSFPPCTFETRVGRTLVRPAETEPAERNDTLGEPDERRELVGWEERHPSTPEPFDSCREPEVLDRHRARPQVGVGERRAPEHATGRRATVTADDEAHRSLPDAVELEIAHVPSLCVPEAVRLAERFALRDDRGPLAGRGFGDEDEPPRLGVSDRRRRVRSRDHPVEECRVEGIGPEASDVPTGRDEGVERVPCRGVERPASRFG